MGGRVADRSPAEGVAANESQAVRDAQLDQEQRGRRYEGQGFRDAILPMLDFRLYGDTRMTDTHEPHWTHMDQRNIIRELIVHEDKLTTERIQALYTMQGFLFASFGLLAGKGLPPSAPLAAMITVFAIVGFTAALFYLQELEFNTEAITTLMADWEKLRKLCPDIPKVIGRYTLGKQPRFLSRRAIPVLFMTIWLFVLTLVWWKELRLLI